MKMTMRVSAKKILSILPLPIIILIIIWHYHFVSFTPDVSSAVVQQRTDKELLNNPTVLTAYKNRLSKLQVKGQGTIIKLLKDDLEGSRHQRILLKVNPGQTLLIAHNIDLASRIADLSVGETLEFYGEYIWNNKGGVVHWTHRDPRSKHLNGWLKYHGKVYQ